MWVAALQVVSKKCYFFLYPSNTISEIKGLVGFTFYFGTELMCGTPCKGLMHGDWTGQVAILRQGRVK
jgi:hypothetical protein